MWTKTTVIEKSGKTSKAMDSLFESMSEMFENMSTIMGDAEICDEKEEKEDGIETGGVFKVDSENGLICITANNGHIVIEGDLKSLRINGVVVAEEGWRR